MRVFAPLTLKVIEQNTIGKYTTTPSNEDAVVVTPYYAAVIDGATPKTSFRYPNGETPGARAARLLVSAIEQLPQQADAFSAIAQLSATLHQEDVTAANRPTASIVIYSNYRREIWMVGDCQYALLSSQSEKRFRTFGNPKRIDAILSRWRGDIIRSLLSRSVCQQEDIVIHDPGRDIIQPFITRQVRFQNLAEEHPLAYGALDGEKVPQRFILCQPVESEVEQIILASDGYPKLFGTLQETEDELQRLLSIDPLCIGPLAGTKGVKPGNISYDDRTYLRLNL